MVIWSAANPYSGRVCTSSEKPTPGTLSTVARVVPRLVAAREPGVRRVRLVAAEDAVARVLPAVRAAEDDAGVRDRLRRARVGHRGGERDAAADARRRGDLQLRVGEPEPRR